jgi:hypothetical protein
LAAKHSVIRRAEYSMARLPVSGGDSGTWGDVLNDYLSQSHTASGSLKPDTVGSAQIQGGSITSSHIAPGTSPATLTTIATSSGTATSGIINRYNATSSTIAVTAPPVAAADIRYSVMKADTSPNPVTIDGFALSRQHACVTFQSDGSVWVPVDFSAGTAELTKLIVDGQYRPEYSMNTLNLQSGKAGDFMVPAGLQYSGGPMTVVANREYVYPFWIPTGLDVTGLTFFVTATVPGSIGRVGVRADDAGYPGDLLAELGTISAGTSLWRPVFFTFTPPTNLIWMTLKLEGGTPSLAMAAGIPALSNVVLDPWLVPRGLPMGAGSAGAFPVTFPSPRGTTTGAASFPFININLG